jgi:hypothetical protein
MARRDPGGPDAGPADSLLPAPWPPSAWRNAGATSVLSSSIARIRLGLP